MKTANWISLLVFAGSLHVSVQGQSPGAVLWAFEAEPRVVINPDPDLGFTNIEPAYVFGSPAVGGDGSVYFGAGNGKFYALNPDGTRKWDYQTGAEIQSSPALADDGTVYFGSADGKLHALRPDGTLSWSFPTGGLILSSPALGSDGTIYIGSRDDHLYAVNPDGTQRWRFSTGRDVDSAPVVGSDGTILAGSTDGNLYALRGDGTEKWRFTYSTGPAGGLGVGVSIGADGTIYACVAGDENALHALHPEDGRQLWRYPFGPPMALVYSVVPVIGADGTIYLGTPDRKFYAIKPDGTQRWELFTDTAGHSTAVLGNDGLIYVNTWDLKALAIRPDGSVAWEFPMAGPAVGGGFTAIPTLTASGTMYLGSGNGKVYAIKTSSGFANSPWPMFGRNARHSANAAAGLVRVPRLRIDGIAAGSGTMLKLRGDMGVRFRIESSNDLRGWQSCAELEGTGTWQDCPMRGATDSTRFFRAVYAADGDSL